MRATKRVLIGSLAAASVSASRGDVDRHAVDLEQDAAGLDAARPRTRARPCPSPCGLRVGFFDTGTSGKTRIQTRPARFMWRVMRAAGGLDLARGDALRLHRLQAELAEVERRAALGGAVDAALVALRNLVRFGCSMTYALVPRPLARARARSRRGRPASAFGQALVLRHRIVLHDLALEDPDLDAAGAVGGEGGGDAVVDVGAQRVQRHAALAIPFHARDLGAAEAARAVDADALGAEPHRRLHGALHGAAERDAALELLGDRFGDQRARRARACGSRRC